MNNFKIHYTKNFEIIIIPISTRGTGGTVYSCAYTERKTYSTTLSYYRITLDPQKMTSSRGLRPTAVAEVSDHGRTEDPILLAQDMRFKAVIRG
jgi:hypothetical protein